MTGCEHTYPVSASHTGTVVSRTRGDMHPRIYLMIVSPQEMYVLA